MSHFPAGRCGFLTAPIDWDQVNLVLCDADADYVMPVKANQKSLLDDIRTLLEPLASARTASEQTEALKKTHAALGAHLDTDETIDKRTRLD